MAKLKNNKPNGKFGLKVIYSRHPDKPRTYWMPTEAARNEGIQELKNDGKAVLHWTKVNR